MRRAAELAAIFALLVLMFVLAGGAALRESATVDEIAHVGAGLSYLQRFELRLNPEHPPLAKTIAALPLALSGTHADYTSPAWKLAADFFPAFTAQWMFGDAVLGRWNDWKSTLFWSRLPMLLLTLVLGWLLYRYGKQLGGMWGGLLCLFAYVTTPAFLVFGPLVLTDVPVTLFSIIALWQLGELWVQPSRRNSLYFGLAFAAALLSKFTGLLLIPIVLVLFLYTRFWPTEAQPRDKQERKPWRRARWAAVFRACMWAFLFVYIVYFVLSWNQSDEALNRIGSGSWAWIIRRPLMPVWLYIRGVLLILLMGSRTTYLFGHTYPHGIPYYFPIVFAVKSTIGFLVLLALAAVLAIVCRRRRIRVIPEAVRPHWRVLNVGFAVTLLVCLLSRLDISIRHFLIPIALMILMLAPLPRMIASLPRPRLLQALAVVAALSCIVPVVLAYPYFLPSANSLTLGHPVYYVLNDSNVSWNEALPAVARFAREQHLSEVPLDWASISDATLVVPQARVWDCQTPTASDAGKWVVVAAVSILENHNCGYLQQYPHRQLGGGAFYAFQLPTPIPAAGAPGGPPLPSQCKLMWGMPMDARAWSLNVERHPERLEPELQAAMKRFQAQSNQQASAKPANGSGPRSK